MSACCVFRVLEWSRINPEISFKSFLSLGTLWLSNSSRSSEKDTILNVVRINFEDMRLCLSNSEKQYKCARDDRQTGGNTDVRQLRRQLFSVRPPQVEIQEVKILLNIPNLPRPPGFLQPVAFNTLHLTVQFLHCPANLPWTPRVWHCWVALTPYFLLPIFLEPQPWVVNIQSWPFDLSSAGTSEATHGSS